MTNNHPMKNILQSKTFWLNFIAALVAFVPAVKDWLAANPETALSALAAANVLVRFVTSGKVSLFGSEEPKPGTDSGMFPCLLVWITAAGLLCVGLPSCSMTYDGTGKPTFALDPVAMAKLIEDWQTRNDAKDASVIIVRSPKGDNLVATMPDGKVVTETINPAGVIVK
jgi:hypothetical protein